MTLTKRIPLWIDCDPGQDDVIAITTGAYHPAFNLVGVSTVHGNVALEQTTLNALRFLTAINRTDVPVFRGARIPLTGGPLHCPEIHGITGLGGSGRLPKPGFNARDETEFFQSLENAIREHAGELCIAAIGPLTNVAQFFAQYPESRRQIKYLAIMGGGFERFNQNGCAEFNICCDPQAARDVLTDPILSDKIVLAPLDMTSTVRASADKRARILGNPETTSNFRRLMFELTDHFHQLLTKRHGPDYVGPSLHDPVAVAALLHLHGVQDLGYKWSRDTLSVEVIGARAGALEKTGTGTDSGVMILSSVDTDAFWDMLISVYDLVDR
ncbi:LAMI_0B05952g1_1 [Lachancea mirantina]|uniref:LAMI_0B05952g1_1 n=1 Tax=Lachancea mirantina TaxID=1230905 RepID=A0A1G4IWY9_9SACH|nr:LAMI_0B05952g1_1 [Lachancea mirantina]